MSHTETSTYQKCPEQLTGKFKALFFESGWPVTLTAITILKKTKKRVLQVAYSYFQSTFYFKLSFLYGLVHFKCTPFPFQSPCS